MKGYWLAQIIFYKVYGLSDFRAIAILRSLLMLFFFFFLNPYYHISVGKAFLKMGKLDGAEKAFLKAYERDTQNPETNRWIQQLNGEKATRF